MTIKKRGMGGLLLFIVTVLILITCYTFLRLAKPNRISLKECVVKVESWSNDCYKTCKPHSDDYQKCTTGECTNQASLLLNYCSERCRAFTEVEKNKCYTDFEQTNLIRKILRQIEL